MNYYKGRLVELRLGSDDAAYQASIKCPQQAIPDPGRYTMAYVAGGKDVLALPLFSAELEQDGFFSAPPIPSEWLPGTQLHLQGPYGRGFTLPKEITRLALVNLGDSPACLMPIVEHALEDNSAVAFYAESPIYTLPSAVEVNPLSSLPEAYEWADFVAVHISLESIQDLRGMLAIDGGVKNLQIPAQVLVKAHMSCAGMADCGVCALPAGRRMVLACKHGPVFTLEELLRYV